MEDVGKTEELKRVKKKALRHLMRPSCVTPDDRADISKRFAALKGRRRCNSCSFCPGIKLDCCAFSGNNNNFESWHRHISGGNENSALLVMMLFFFVLTGERTVAALNWGERLTLTPNTSATLPLSVYFFFFQSLLLKADGNLPNNECAKTCWYFYCSCKFLLYIIYIMAVAFSFFFDFLDSDAIKKIWCHVNCISQKKKYIFIFSECYKFVDFRQDVCQLILTKLQHVVMFHFNAGSMPLKWNNAEFSWCRRFNQ